MYVLSKFLILLSLPVAFASSIPPYSGISPLESTIVIPTVQYNFTDTNGQADRRENVTAAIKRTWDLYVQQAWGSDEVTPVTGKGQDPRFRFLKNC